MKKRFTTTTRLAWKAIVLKRIIIDTGRTIDLSANSAPDWMQPVGDTPSQGSCRLFSAILARAINDATWTFAGHPFNQNEKTRIH
jgi:hypothetical protein